jgi:hypothetical protein
MESERVGATGASEGDDMHHSIADADDIEEVWEDEINVGDVFRSLLRHPWQLITRWNWKAVFLAVIVRGSFYLTIYTLSRESWLVTATAVLVELFFRFLTTGVAGAAVQSFRKAKPVWLANIIVSILLPAFSHSIEFASHYIQERYFYDIFAASENSGRQKTFAISVLFSVVSVLFNLYAMRNGVLLVGAGEKTQSLRNDMKHIPRLIGQFVATLPVLISQFIETGKLLYAFGAFFAFGMTVGTILGTFRFKWQWGWEGALGAWGALLVVTVFTVVIRRILGHNISSEEV